MTTDSAIVAESWAADFAYMTESTEDWMNSIEDYV
jgi:hypothetical protein